MEFLRRVLGGRRVVPPAAPLALFDSSMAPDSLRTDTVLAALDIDAALEAHERWKERLMDYLEGRTPYGLDPAMLRRCDNGALGRWLHGVGWHMLGDQPAFALLMARHQYFREQAAILVEFAQKGEWDKAVHVLNGSYRYGSSQVVLLLKELKRGLG